MLKEKLLVKNLIFYFNVHITFLLCGKLKQLS